MKNISLQIIYVLCYYLGINKLFYFFTRNRQRVITFHNVIPKNLFDHSIHLGVSCSNETFEFQLKEIEKKFKITTEIGLPSSCILTFDDGYSNKYECTHHILKKHSHKAVFFITSGLVQKNELLWVDKLLMYFSYLKDGEYQIMDQKFIIDSEGRARAYNKAYLFILSNYHLKDKFMNQLNENIAFSEINRELYKLRFNALEIQHIEEMKSYGHLIACHSTAHDILSQLTAAELGKELNDCEQLLESIYNCDYFSYPFGSDLEVNQQVINRLKSSKFKYGFKNQWSLHPNEDNYQIQRMALPNTQNKYLIHAYLSGTYYFLKRIFD